ncbi:MAG: hypothetical protein V3U89_08290 [Methylophilaceae bacterium]
MLRNINRETVEMHPNALLNRTKQGVQMKTARSVRQVSTTLCLLYFTKN